MVVASAVAALAVARPFPLSLLTGQRVLKFKAFCCSSAPSRKLVLYSKPGCCLCDGLKEKLQAAFLLSGPDSLGDIDFQIRDITSNPEWEKAYQYEIPVLAKVLSDGTERGPSYTNLLVHFINEEPMVWRLHRNAMHGAGVGPSIVWSELKKTLPRLSPRLGVEHLQKKIAAALREQ